METTAEVTRRRFLATAGVTVGSVALAGCGGGSSKNSIPLHTDETDPPSIVFYQAAIKAFERQHPKLSVNLDLVSVDAKVTQDISAFATGQNVGIFTLDVPSAPLWARQGKLLKLDPLVEKIGASDFLSGSRMVVGGHDYIMPYQGAAYLLYVRDDLLAAHGLKAPTTYDELLNAARTLNSTRRAGISLPIGTQGSITSAFFAPFVYQSGWDYYDRDGNLTFDKPEVLDGVKRYMALMQYAPSSLKGNAGFQDVINAYVSDRAAMAVYGGRLGAQLAAQNSKLVDMTSVHPLPAGPVLTGKVVGGLLAAYAIDAREPNPGAALEFLQYIVTGRQGAAFANTVPGMLLPQLKSVVAMAHATKTPYETQHAAIVDEFYAEAPNFANPADNMGSVNNGTFQKVGNIMPWGTQAVSGNTPVDGTMLQKIAVGGQSAESAWKAAAAQLGSIATQWKKQHPSWTPTA